MLNLTKALELTIKAREDITATLELENLIKEDMAVEAAKSKGVINTFKSIKKILDKNKKNYPDKRVLHGAWVDAIEEKQYVSNGYYIIEINKPIEGLPQLEPGVKPLNGKSFFADTDMYTKEIELNIPELKLQFKQAQAEARAKRVEITKVSKAHVKLGTSWYPIDQLMDIVGVLGESIKAYGEETAVRPCLLVSDIGRALIMPIKIKG